MSTQAERFDRAAERSITTFDDVLRQKALHLARQRLADQGSTHELQSIDCRRARAALAGCRESYYADMISGRRNSSDGTVVKWLRTWADSGLPPLDSVAILQLPEPGQREAMGA